MARAKFEAIAELTFDTKNASKSADKFLTDIERRLTNINNSADKFPMFENFVEYLSAIDRKLTSIKKKDIGFFNQMFSDIDVTMLSKFKDIFKIDSKSLSQMEVLVEKAGSFKKGSSIEEAKAFVDELNNLNKEITGKPLFEKLDRSFSNKKVTTKTLEAMNALVVQFGTNWRNMVNDVSVTLSKGFPEGIETAVKDQLKENVKTYEDYLKEMKQIQKDIDKVLEGGHLSANEGIEKITKEEVEKMASEYEKLEALESAALKQGNYKEYFDLMNQRTKLGTKIYEAMGQQQISLSMSEELEELEENIGYDFQDYKKEINKSELLEKLKKELSNKNKEDEPKASEIIDTSKVKTETKEVQKLDTTVGEVSDGLEDGKKAAKDFGDSIEKVAVDSSEYVKVMSGNIKEMFALLSKPLDTEFSVLMNGTDINLAKGIDSQVPLDTVLSHLLKNVPTGVSFKAHTHQGTAPELNHYDLRNVIESFYSGVAKLSGTIGKEEIATWNLEGVAREDAEKVLEIIKKEIETTNKSGYNAKEVNKIFAGINPNYKNVAKYWKPEEFDLLAKYIYNVGDAARRSTTPLENFKNIFKFGDPNFDINNFPELFKDFDPEDAIGSFNRIMENLRSQRHVEEESVFSTSELEKSIEEEISLLDYRRKQAVENAELTYEDIRKATIEYLDSSNRQKSKVWDSFFGKYFHPLETPELNEILGQDRTTMGAEGISRSIANYFGISTEDMEDLVDGVGEVNAELSKQEKIVSNIQDIGKSKYESFLETYKKDNIDVTVFDNDKEVGKFLGGLESAKKGLIEISKEAGFTEDQLKKIDEVYSEAVKMAKSFINDYTGYGSGYGDGEYDYTYEQEYYQANEEIVALEKQKKELEQEKKNLEEELSKKKKSGSGEGTGDGVTDLNAEYEQLRALVLQLDAVKTAINEKTDAFKNEGNVVHSVIENELKDLGDLLGKVDNISSAAKNKQKKQDKIPISEKEKNELSELDSKLQEVTSRVEMKSLAFANESAVVEASVRGELQDLDMLLTKLKELEEITSKVSNQFSNIKLTKAQLKNLKEFTEKEREENKKKSVIKNIGYRRLREDSMLTKQQALWDKTGKLDDNARSQIEEIKKSLKTVTNSDELKVWKYQWETIKNEILSTRYQLEKLKKEQDSMWNQHNEPHSKKNIEKEFNLGYIEYELNNQHEEIEIKEQTKSETAYWDRILNAEKQRRDKIAILAKEKAQIKREEDQMWAEYNKSISEKKEIETKESWKIYDEDNVSKEKDISSRTTSEVSYWKRELEEQELIIAQGLEIARNRNESLKKVKDEEDQMWSEYNKSKVRKKSEIKKETDNSWSIYFSEQNKQEAEIERRTAIEKAYWTNQLKEQEEIEDIKSKLSKYQNTFVTNSKFKKTGIDNNIRESGLSDSAIIQEVYNKYSLAYEKVMNKIAEIKSKNRAVSEDDAAELQTAKLEMSEYQKELNRLISQSNKLKKRGFETEILETDFEDNIAGRKSALRDFALSLDGVDQSTISFSKNAEKCNFIIKNMDGTFTNVTAQFDEAKSAIVAVEGSTKEIVGGLQGLWNELKFKFKSIGSYLVASFGFTEIWQGIKQGLTYVKEIDSALTELKKVTNETDSSYKNFLNTMAQTASIVGGTISDLTLMTAEWARLGYTMEEAGVLAKNTAILLNVSEFKDATEASEALISLMQAFGKTASDSGNVVDILNEVGNNFAISSDGIATALKHSASALMEAGNDLEQSVALVASANKVVQDPDSVGSALRTISLRLRGTKVDVLEKMGEDIDGVAESTSKLQEKVLALTKINGVSDGINILKYDGSYKDTYTILKEIGEVWEHMNDIDQAALLELLAGKNRANTLAAILGNMDDLKDAYESALNAEGSAFEENEKFLDSIQGRIELFKNSVQNMWKNLIDSDAVKFFVDLGTGIVNVIDKIGILTPMLTAFSGYKFISSGIKSGLEDAKNNIGFNSENGEQKVSFYKKIADSIKEIASAKEIETDAENKSVGAKMKSAAASLASAHADDIAAIKAKGLAIAKGALLGLAKGLAIGAITFGVSKIIQGINDQIHEAERLKDEIQDLEKKYYDSAKNIKDNLKTLAEPSDKKTYSDLSEEFQHLTQGVNELGENVSLTSDEYERYTSICETLIGINPDLGKGYDSVTEAIGNNASVLSDLIELEKEQAKINAQEYVSPENTKKIIKNKTEDLRILNNELNQLRDMNPGRYSELFDLLSKNFGKEYTTQINETSPENDVRAFIKDILQTIGAYNYEDIINEYISHTSPASGYEPIFDYDRFFDDYFDIIIKNISKFNSPDLTYFADKYNSTKKKIEDISSDMLDYYLQVPISSDDWNSLGKKSQNFIKDWIENSGYFNIDEETTKEDIEANKEKILAIISDMANDIYSAVVFTDNKEIKYSANSIVDKIFDLDKAKLSWKEYKSEIIKWVESLWKAIGSSENKFGFKDQDSLLDILGVKNIDIGEELNKIYKQAHPELDIDLQETTEDKMIKRYSEIKKITEKDAKEYFESLSAVTVNRLLEVNWSQVGEENIDSVLSDAVNVDISDYSGEVTQITNEIVTLNEALDKLNEEKFTLADFMELIKQFPKLAKGVDISNKKFKGLERNLKNAIKASPKKVIKDLNQLKKSIELVGGSTENIDALISAFKHIPETNVDDLTEKYTTLTEQIRSARLAQDELTKALEEKSNPGYETRSEAIEKMKNLMADGLIGSDSELWNIADKFGFTYDSAKTINENADALYDFINARDSWYKKDKEGNYTFESIESFIEDVESVVDSGIADDLGVIWDYSDGKFEFDIDNKNFDEFIERLNESGKFIHITREEFTDLLKEAGRRFEINWEDYDDIMYHLQEIKDQDIPIENKVEEYKSEMQAAFGKGDVDLTVRPKVKFDTENFKEWYDYYQEELKKAQESGNVDLAANYQEQINNLEQGNGTATVYPNTYFASDFRELKTGEQDKAIVLTPILPDGSVISPQALEQFAEDALNGKEIEPNITLGIFDSKEDLEGFEEYLHQAQAWMIELENKLDPLKILDLNPEEIFKIPEFKEAISTINGLQIVDKNIFKQILTDAEYSDEQVNALVTKILELNEQSGYLVESKETDPFGFYQAGISASELKRNLEELQISFSNLENGKIEIDMVSLQTALNNSGWTEEEIQSYLNKISTGLSIDNVGITFKNVEQVITEQDQIIDNQDSIKEPVNVEINIVGDGAEVSKQVLDNCEKLDGKVTRHEIITDRTILTNYKTNSSGLVFAQGKNNHDKSSGTSLVGELGPEMLVRDGQWSLVGQDGAEFRNVKPNDIIFDHKQTKQLLDQGGINTRGKAYASGSSSKKKYYFSDIESAKSSNESKSSNTSTTASADDIVDKLNEILDWIEIRLEEIDKQISLYGAKLENAINLPDQNKLIDDMIDLNQLLYKNLLAGSEEYHSYAKDLLDKIPAEYREMAQNGAIAIESFTKEADEETIEAIQSYREWIGKADDATVRAEETLKEISTLARQAITNIEQNSENINSITESKIAQLEAYNKYLETTQGSESSGIYDAIISANNAKIQELQAQRDAMQMELDEAVKEGNIKKGSQDWYDSVNAIAAVDTEIIQLMTDVENYQDTINQLHWDNFERFKGLLSSISGEADNLISILGEEKLVDENGMFTDEGITSLGLYAQKMEIAEKQASSYKKEINYLNANWKDLGYTEQEYIEKLDELKSGQYESIKAYQDSKQAIVDLTRARVDEVKNGIQEEITAYEKLINAKKEELTAEKSLHDFKKSVKEQEKDIADIERQLEALSMDNSASARAKRAQLEAELAEKKNALDESYYDRSVEDQQTALDKELENFQEEKNKEIEEWDKYLEDTEKIVQDSLNTVQTNTDLIYQNLQALGQEYSINISENLTTPWLDGQNAIHSYETYFGQSMSSMSSMLDEIGNKYDALNQKIQDISGAYENQVEQNHNKYQDAEFIPQEPESSPEPEKNESYTNPLPSRGDSVVVKTSASRFGSNSGNASMASFVPGGSYTAYQVDGTGYDAQVLIGRNGQYTGWVNLRDLEGYAKGSKGVKTNQLAWIDELGEELQFVPGQNGRLEYIKKGTSILNSELTNRIMDLAMNPQAMLDNNAPRISVSPEIHNNTISIDNSISELIHIDNCTTESVHDVKKIVDQALEKHMERMNNSLKKYVR